MVWIVLVKYPRILVTIHNPINFTLPTYKRTLILFSYYNFIKIYIQIVSQ